MKQQEIILMLRAFFVLVLTAYILIPEGIWALLLISVAAVLSIITLTVIIILEIKQNKGKAEEPDEWDEELMGRSAIRAVMCSGLFFSVLGVVAFFLDFSLLFGTKDIPVLLIITANIPRLIQDGLYIYYKLLD